MNEEKRFTLRMDANLFEIIKLQADKNKRSVAKEIEYILENYATANGLIKNTDTDQ